MKYAALVFSLILTADLPADDWPNWRGPNSNGVAEAGNYPLHWDNRKNILWKIELPGPGASTPAILGERIFISCGEDGKNTVLCFDRSGKQLWKSQVGKENPGKHKKATGSNSSPLTDGERVFVYFKSGDFAAFDLDGRKLWSQNLQDKFGENTLWWDLGTSPVLTSKHVVVACVQSEPSPSYLAGFDKQTGELAWKSKRMLPAPEEANQSYSTPIVHTHHGKEMIYVLGADHVTGHDAKDGREIWRVGDLNPEQNGYFRSIASPVVVGEILVAPYARGSTLTGIKLGGKGDVTSSHVLWTVKWEKKDKSVDVPTPAADGENVIVCADKRVLVCMNSKTGEIVWEQPFSKGKSRTQFSASPTIAGDHIYVTSESGETFVIDHSAKPQLVAQNSLDGEFTVATPVLVDDLVFIRSVRSLYCIGRK